MFNDNADFFPTPRAIARQMLAKVSKDAVNFLEPSAGKGDIAEVLRGEESQGYYGSRGTWGSSHQHKVDCIEASPDLAKILQGKGFPVVGYDWLTFGGVCYYDAILANPPFSAGAEHLLRMWDFMHDGEIVCLLNEETLSNPYTAERQRLAAIIAEHGSVERLGDCFSRAERKTGVNVVMVYLRKKSADDRIEAWAMGTPEKPVDEEIGSPENLLAIRDELGNMEHYYNEATTHMLKAFQHLRKAALWMDANGVHVHSEDYRTIAAMGLGNINAAHAEFARKHRRDAWMQVFQKMQFRKWLDKKQTEQFVRDIETNSNIPFTADNIKGTLENVFLQRGKLFEMSVANVFDELTRYFKGNANHEEGWKSNDNHKVNLKLVFPYGCEFCSIMKNFRLRWSGSSIDIYNDLDRVLCVLDGENFETVGTIAKTLENAFNRSKEPGICESRYFEIRYFKKGTIHLKWKRKDLWEAFNVKAAAGKKWLGKNTRDAA